MLLASMSQIARADRPPCSLTATRYYVWRHLQRVRHHVSFEVDDADLAHIEPWAQAANALLFLPDGSIRAPDGAVVIDAAGEGDPQAALPHPADAVARRARTRTLLADAPLQPPAGMAPALGEGELVLRGAGEVLAPALGLLYVAARAHARATGLPAIPAGQEAHNPIGAAALTSQKQAFVTDEGTDTDAAAALTWRYEAANTLLWALGVTGASIDDSAAMADVDRLWASVAPLARRPDGQAIRLRPAGESSMRWTVRGSNTGSSGRRARKRWRPERRRGDGAAPRAQLADQFPERCRYRVGRYRYADVTGEAS